MSIVSDAVKILENRISGSGCEDGIVRITPASSAGCPYEDGITIVTEYGGRVAELSTSFPFETTSKVSFMFDSPLKSPVQRTAACAILNVISSFMCFTRKGRACGEESRKACLDELIAAVAGKKVYLNGCLTNLESMLYEAGSLYPEKRVALVGRPGDADVIIVSGDGLFDKEKLAVTGRYFKGGDNAADSDNTGNAGAGNAGAAASKEQSEGQPELIFIGPAVTGFCVMQGAKHHCPYGRR